MSSFTWMSFSLVSDQKRPKRQWMINDFQYCQTFNTLRLRQNGCYFAYNIFKCIFLNASVWISLKISLKFVHKVPMNNIPASVHMMARHQPGDQPLYETMIFSLLPHIYVTWPQCINSKKTSFNSNYWNLQIYTLFFILPFTKRPQYFQWCLDVVI